MSRVGLCLYLPLCWGAQALAHGLKPRVLPFPEKMRVASTNERASRGAVGVGLFELFLSAHLQWKPERCSSLRRRGMLAEGHLFLPRCAVLSGGEVCLWPKVLHI